MKSFNTKLVLSVLGIAMLATPVLAQQPHRQQVPQGLYNYQAPAADPAGTYPNPVAHTGSAQSIESGAAFNLGR